MASILRRAGSKESAASCNSAARADADSENLAPAVPNQRKFSKQALAFMSMGSDRSAPGSTRVGNALSDITNMFCSSRGGGRKASKAAVDRLQEIGEVPTDLAEAPVATHAEGLVASRPRANVSVSQRQTFAAQEHNTMFANDHQELFRCAEYAPDIVAAFFRTETAKMPDARYMMAQTEVNPKMRGILVDWLLEVHSKYKMQTETLFLTVNIIDRYMSLRQVKKRQLQLLGVVAMFIASKYEELNPPKAAALAYLTDNAYSRGQIIDFEFEVLNALNCDVVVVTPASFLDRLTRANGCQPLQRALVSYLVELSLPETHMLRHVPSQLVSAAILLSNDLLGSRPRWSAAMAHHSHHSEAALQPIADELYELLEKAPVSSLQAAQRKYQTEGNHRVSSLTLRRS